MSIINYAAKVMNFKLVYYGPGLAGKTANLQFIHRCLPDTNRGKMISLATGDDRTLFFDFLPVSATGVRGFTTRFQLYTVPGQTLYNMATTPCVLQYNKRDLGHVAPLDYLEYLLNRGTPRVPFFEAVALDGRGVFETLNTVSRMVLVREFGQAQEVRS